MTRTSSSSWASATARTMLQLNEPLRAFLRSGRLSRSTRTCPTVSIMRSDMTPRCHAAAPGGPKFGGSMWTLGLVDPHEGQVEVLPPRSADVLGGLPTAGDPVRIHLGDEALEEVGVLSVESPVGAVPVHGEEPAD